MNITEIKEEIQRLEKSETSLSNIRTLASLYTVYEGLTDKSETSNVEAELNDILPEYRKYCDIKRKYQLKELTSEAVLNSLNRVCKEIYEFMQTMYRGTDMPEERKVIHNLMVKLKTDF